MTSNEAIQELYNEREYLLGEKVNNKTKNWHNDIKHYDNINHCLLTIREDLDRLEKLEKENKELKEKVNHFKKVNEDIKNLPNCDFTHKFDNCKLAQLPKLLELEDYKMNKQVVVRTYPYGYTKTTEDLQICLNNGYSVVMVNKITSDLSVEVLEYILEK